MYGSSGAGAKLLRVGETRKQLLMYLHGGAGGGLRSAKRQKGKKDNNDKKKEDQSLDPSCYRQRCVGAGAADVTGPLTAKL